LKSIFSGASMSMTSERWTRSMTFDEYFFFSSAVVGFAAARS
jgi:hypothetical protein